MAGEDETRRRGLTAHDRALLKSLVDAELRRREQDERQRTEAIKKRYLEQVADRKGAYRAA